MNNNIIEKIKKLLALSSNNPNMEEAQTAALRAQRLIAKYNVSIEQIEDKEYKDNIDETEEYVGSGKKFKYALASIIADNFRCKSYWKGTEYVMFYGYETDREAAKEVFKYVFKVMCTLGKKERSKYKGNTKGVFNTYVLGFLQGLYNNFSKQSKALMIITPEEVDSSYKEKSKNFREINSHIDTSSYQDRETLMKVYDKGVDDGSHVMGTRELEGSR